MTTPADPIAEARSAAIALLKPSSRDLEYGLALHRESVVVESYGLGLHAPVDAAILNSTIDAGALSLEIQDLQEEMIMTRWVADSALREEYQMAWEAAGVNCIFLNAGEEGGDPLTLLKRLARYTALTDAMPDFLQRALTIDDILAGAKLGKRSLCLSLNSVPLACESSTAEGRLAPVRVFAQLGARMMHLTYNRRNLLADGCSEANDGGLSDFGRTAIVEMNRLGIIIDVAHTGWKSCREAARASTNPIIASHSGAWTLNPHTRCKPDDTIRAIVDGGGAVGVTTVPRFLGGDGTILAMLAHIDYIAKRFGPESVTIGTDAPYVSRHAASAWRTLNNSPVRRPHLEHFWIPGEEAYTPEWSKPAQTQSLAWTNWPMFTVGLVQLGYSDEVVRKIIGGNMLRIAGQAWRSPIGAI